MFRALRLLVILMLPGLALGQGAEPDESELEKRSLGDQLQARFFGSFKQLGEWDEQYGLMMDAVEKVYDRNGWDSESDQFSLDVIRSVEELPPWDALGRFSRLSEMISDRYMLDEPQYKKLQQLIIDEANGLFAEHGPRIMQYGVEIIQTRAAGEAFTPEQVQRWSELAEPVFEAVRARMNTAAHRFAGELDPEQRELFRNDLEAANRRLQRVSDMSAEWRAGQWQPDDWGMEEDPIQLAGMQRDPAAFEPRPRKEPTPEKPNETPTDDPGPPDTPPAGGGEAARPAEPSPGPKPAAPAKIEADDAWARYVKEFIRKYALDDAQQQRAWIVYRDARTRGDAMAARLTPQIEAARRRGDSEAARKQATQLEQQQAESLERVFEQMKRRLERLPTTAQRKAVAGAPAADKPARPASGGKP